MHSTSENRRSSRSPRRRLFLSPAVTTMRRGSHRPAVAPAASGAQSIDATPAAGVNLITSARGVRLSSR